MFSKQKMLAEEEGGLIVDAIIVDLSPRYIYTLKMMGGMWGRIYLFW